MIGFLRRAPRARKSRVVTLLVASLAASPAGASKPCREADWRQEARWVAVGVVTARHERKVPYPDCALPDPAQCAQWDRSELVVRVERYERGQGPAELRLVAAWCAPAPPREAGGRYRFYGDGTTEYVFWEAATVPPVVQRPRIADTTPFTFESWGPARPYFQNGDWVSFEVAYGGDTSGLAVTADFSGMDSGYARGAERVEGLGSGRFRVGYRLTRGNAVEDGDRPVSVVATGDRGTVARVLDVPLRNLPPAPFTISTPTWRTDGLLDCQALVAPPGRPQAVRVVEGDGQTIVPDVPAAFRLAWEAGPAPVAALWIRAAGYRGCYRIPLRPDQTAETVTVVLASSTPEHRAGPFPSGEPTFDAVLEYLMPRGRKVPPGERVSAATPVRYRILEPPAGDAERFPPKRTRE